MNATVGPATVTRVEPFGLVLRADFEIGDLLDQNGVNRIICWINEDVSPMIVIAVVQDVPPLGD